MKLKNISLSKYEFTARGQSNKPETIAVAPGGILEVEDGHHESMAKLAQQFPKDWIVVEEELTTDELEKELAKRKAAEAKAKKAEADAAPKSKADAKSAEKEEKKGA